MLFEGLLPVPKYYNGNKSKSSCCGLCQVYDRRVSPTDGSSHDEVVCVPNEDRVVPKGAAKNRERKRLVV